MQVTLLLWLPVIQKGMTATCLPMIWNLYDSGSTDVLETVVSLLKLLYKLADRGRRPPVVTQRQGYHRSRKKILQGLGKVRKGKLTF